MARIIVDIPDSMIKAMYDNGKGAIDMLKTELYQRLVYQSDILPDNATNRDVLKAIFPECSIDDTGSGTYLKFKDNMFSMMVENDWLNAPYKEGDTEESDAEFMCKAMSKTVNKSTDDRNFYGGF